MAPAALALTEMFRLSPQADLRTPRNTFDTFCRSILTEQPEPLWQCIHPDLRHMMQRRMQVEGPDRFFARMKPIVCTPAGRLRLGEPREVGSAAVVCSLLRGSREVGKAWFSFGNREWVLTQLS